MYCHIDCTHWNFMSYTIVRCNFIYKKWCFIGLSMFYMH